MIICICIKQMGGVKMNKENEHFTKLTDNKTIEIFKKYTKRNLNEFKLICYILSKMELKYRRMCQDTYNGYAFLNGIEYEQDFNLDEARQIEVSYKELTKNVFKKNFTKKEIYDMTDGVFEIIELLDEKGNKQKVVLIEKVIVPFDESDKLIFRFSLEAMEHIIELKNRYTVLCIETLKQLKTKFEIGLYIKYRMFVHSWYVIMKIEDAREYFGWSDTSNQQHTTPNFVAKLKKHAANLSETLGEEITVTAAKKGPDGREVTHILINFTHTSK